jgi:hypothetical protein
VQLLRKYIAYAREHVHPVLSDEAKDILQVGSSSWSRSAQPTGTTVQGANRCQGPDPVSTEAGPPIRAPCAAHNQALLADIVDNYKE